MFDHVTVRASDFEASAGFYRTVFAPLGFQQDDALGDQAMRWGDFVLAAATDDRPATTGLHVGLVATSEDEIHAFWQAGVDAGYRSDGEPGPRPIYGDDYRGAFLLDPDGNSIEAALHDGIRDDGGHIDHLTIRVPDLAASRGFYEAIQPYAGYRLRAEGADFVRFRAGRGGSFTLKADTRHTAHMHMAFPAADDLTVRDFHAAATGAGHPSNGEPGERLGHLAGAYRAFIADPDGHNVELVHHWDED